MTFAEFLAATQRGATQAAMIEHMTKAAYEMFAPLAQQRFAALAAQRSTGSSQGAAMFFAGLVHPSLGGVWVGNDWTHAALVQLGNLLDGKVAFVRGQLLTKPLQRYLWNCLRQGSNRRHDPLGHPDTIGGIARSNLSADDRSALQVGHMLGPIGHIGRPVLGLAHLRLGIMRVDPLFIAGFAPGPLLVKAPYRLRILWIDAVFCRQLPHVIPVVLLRVAMLQGSQRSVGFNHARIDPKLPALEQSMPAQGSQEHPVDGFQLLQRQALPDHAQRRMIRRRLRQRVTQKPADRQTVRAATGDGSLAAQILKEAHHQHLQVHHRIHPRPSRSRLLRIRRRTDRPHFLRKSYVFQRSVHPSIKRIGCRLRQISSYYPKFLLFCGASSTLKHLLSNLSSRSSTWKYFNRLLRASVLPTLADQDRILLDGTTTTTADDGT